MPEAGYLTSKSDQLEVGANELLDPENPSIKSQPQRIFHSRCVLTTLNLPIIPMHELDCNNFTDEFLSAFWNDNKISKFRTFRKSCLSILIKSRSYHTLHLHPNRILELHKLIMYSIWNRKRNQVNEIAGMIRCGNKNIFLKFRIQSLINLARCIYTQYPLFMA